MGKPRPAPGVPTSNDECTIPGEADKVNEVSHDVADDHHI
jgi:hypothetical protein